MLEKEIDVEDQSFNDEFGLEAQKRFISLLIFDESWALMNGFDIIRPEYFENRVLNRICKWIHSYYEKNKAIPTKLVLMQEAQDFLNEANVSSSTKEYFIYKDAIDTIYCTEGGIAELEFFKEKAVAFVRQMRWKKALENAGRALKISNFEDAIAKFKEVLAVGIENDLGLDFDTMDEDVFLHDLGENYDTQNMIKTGIPDWDKALGGGFVRDNLHIVGAPPGGGKSRTMAFLATQAIKDLKKVIFISLELSKLETMANIKACATGISTNDLLKIENREIYKTKVTTFKNTFGPNLMVQFYKPATVTADTIYNYIQKVIQYKKEKLGIDWKPDVIFLDYLDKLLPTQKLKGSLYEDIGGVADDCKNLAITFHCPVVTGSQLGKFTWNVKGNEVVNLDSLAESSRKAHLAHSITTINVNPGEKAQGKARLFMAKSRSGSPGKTIFIEQNLGKCLLTQVPEWDPVTLQGTDTYTVKGA